MEFTASFIAAPAPDGPRNTWPLVIASRTGAAASYAARSPPTIAKSCAASATVTLPETGASRRYTSRCRASAASSRAASGPIVLISSTMEPGRSLSRSPLSTRTARTAAPSDTIVTTASAEASAAGSPAAVAPSATSGVHRSAVRFHTASGKPARRTFRAIAKPMRPIPAKPAVATFTGRGRLCASMPSGAAGASDKDLPAVDHVHLARHVVGLRRREIHEKRRDLGGRRGPADQCPRREFAHRIGVRRLVVNRADVVVEPDPHRRVDDARCERVDGDAVRDQPARRGLRDSENAELRYTVWNEVPEALAARDRAGIDDLSALTLRDHLPRRFLRAHDHAPRVHADDLVEVVLVDLHEVPRPVHASVVEDHVELAERVDGGSDHGAHLVPIGHVDSRRASGAAVGNDRVRDRLRAVRIEIGDDDLPALARDGAAGGGADPAGSAGHD